MTKILVVDDSSIDRGLIGGIINHATDWEIEFATDGQNALDRLAEVNPDAVLTDLQMPNMDGLQLVAHLRRLQPTLPVVLVTSQGSEDLAIRALREGASNYTSKRLMANDLISTLRAVMDKADRIKKQKRLMNHVVNGAITWQLRNDASLVVPLVEQVQAFVADWDHAEQLRVGMAIDEALVNAIYHGNLEVDSKLRQEDDDAFYDLIKERASLDPYCERKVHIDANFSTDELHIVIRDEGPGFDQSQLLDPTDPKNLERICGRGLLLIRTFMDEVEHNPIGNEISMTKRRSYSTESD